MLNFQQPFLFWSVSCPNIALHKRSNVMEDKIKGLYTRRTQKDYTLSFKLQVVREVESGSIGINAAARKYGIQGHDTITKWRRKYGTLDHNFKADNPMSKSPQQKIQELEQKVRLLEKEKALLEIEMINASDKANILDRLIYLAEQEYGIKVRKNSLPEQLDATPKSSKKQ